MEERWNQSRRQWLGACAGLGSATVLAGCFGSDDDDDDDDSSPEDEGDTGADWPMYGVDLQNTGYHPDAIGPDGSEMTERSIFNLGGISTHAVSIANETVFGHNTTKSMYALDIETEESVWIAEENGPAVIHDDMVFGPSNFGKLYGYDLKTGDEWKSEHNTSVDTYTSYPVPTEDGIYILSQETVWHFDFDTGEYSEIIDIPLSGRGTTDWPAYESGILYITKLLELHAINMSTSEIEWTFKTEGEAGLVESNPTVANEVVCVTSGDDQLHAVDKESGKERWSIEIHTEASPAFANNLFYIAESNRVIAVDSTTGEIEWEESEESIHSPHDVIIAGNVCYVTTRAGLWAYDADTGNLHWEYKVPDESDIRFSGPPTFYNNRVYIPSENENLYVIEDVD